MFTEFAREDEQFFVRDFLAINPAMSVVSEKVVAANPSFWQPKTATVKASAKAATTAGKKEPAKTEKK